MSQEQLEALLGRPLTSREVTNLDLYLEIAQESLEELLCISLETYGDDSGDPEAEARTFDVREGYSTVFTDIFTDVTEVKVDGAAITVYYPAFWDRRNSPYYNSIVLEECGGSSVEITATWGFDTLPKDLQTLWAQLFANVSKAYKAGGGNVKSKQVEDFRVTYGDLTDDQSFLDLNARTIRKYSMCTIGFVRHGSTCETHGRYNCGHCL